MKNLITSALLLLAILLPATAGAYDFEVDGIYYNINGTEASVTYGYLASYKGEVKIPSTVTYNGTTYSVTAIGEYAFEGCRDLTSIDIPNSVIIIGYKAFYFCIGLTSITIPNSVTSIGDSAFGNCNVLTSITIPNSVTSIGDSAFGGCSELTSITIPNSVTSIGDIAFGGCSGLTDIKVTDGNPIYDSRDNCNAIVETSSNTLIVGCKNTVIPNSVTSIGDGAFIGCSSLTRVTIPNSITAIGNSAFFNCSGLSSITIPNSVTTIGESAFWGCSNITSVSIGSSVTAIGDCVFRECTGLTSVTIPNSVTSIGDGAFMDCSGLTSVTIPNSVTSIGYAAFENCGGLTNVIIPNSVTSIGEGAFFNCSRLTNLTIPNSVTSIGDNAFGSCSGLTDIRVTDGNPFYDSRDNCNAIIETSSNTLIVGCKNTVIPNSVTSIGDGAFGGCNSLTSVTIPNSVTHIGNYAFYGCSGLTSITIPDSVTTIGRNAFACCREMTSITIPNSVTHISNYTFYECSGLTNITIPNSITSIGYMAFYVCSGLKSVTIPNSVTHIDEYAFAECSGLTDVYSCIINPSTISMGYHVFFDSELDEDYSGRTLHVPYGTAAGYQADNKWSEYFNHIVEMDPLHGDVNVDGEVNISDINVVTDIIVGASLDNETMQRADVNGDGSINISDVNVILDIILSGDEEPVAEHEWVDLGLPSGTLWATCNVGANSPEDYGDHFAWGETEPKGLYDWSTYKWCLKYEDVWVKELKKYNDNSYLGAVDNKIELDLEDDAAYVNWGPKWRMPTLEQFQELCNCCAWQWTTLNDVNGQLVTGPNGKTIFLPAAGGFSSHIYWQGENGYYWSRTLCTPDKWDIPNEGDGSSHAYIQFFGRSRWHVWYDVRCDGQSVRAVRVP